MYSLECRVKTYIVKSLRNLCSIIQINSRLSLVIHDYHVLYTHIFIDQCIQ